MVSVCVYDRGDDCVPVLSLTCAKKLREYESVSYPIAEPHRGF